MPLRDPAARATGFASVPFHTPLGTGGASGTRVSRWHVARRVALVVSAALALLGSVSPAWAQRNVSDIPAPDPELERKSFEVAPGFEVNLFAADPLIAKPIHMNFDSRGRLWIASSKTYPQIAPGQEADDKVLLVEDRDGDGVADKTSVFADGLLIPTGIVPGDGGVYVANSTELVHFRDTDGDGRADARRIVLSGFGTEDTHHILHTLRWGPDGMLYMNQSIYIHSHIETPYGVRRMNGGGIWCFRPRTMELETFILGLINPWGHHFDRFGQSFATDGAGGEGINPVFPGWVGVTSPDAKRVMHGLNPGSPKYCGLEILSGRHLPPDWQGNIITNDFRAHRVCRFVLGDDGSSFSARQEKDLIRTTHVAFRPVDVKMGPDGAIYIADWYNPIIQHGEVDFRDPRRDHVHGRIWRVTARGRPLVSRPRLADVPIDELLDALKAPEQWTRHHAKRVLSERDPGDVLPNLAAWTAQLDPTDDAYEHHKLEALWTCQTLDHVEPQLLGALLRAGDPRVRAAATRVVYHWHARLADPLGLLAQQVGDAHPRVRLEAVRALSRLHDARACEVAMRALEQPMDGPLDFALWTTARDLEPYWLPALQQGRIDFGGRTAQLTYALKAVDAPAVVPLLLAQLTQSQADSAQESGLLHTLAALANAQELRRLFDLALDAKIASARRAQFLAALVDAAQARNVRPLGSLKEIEPLLEADDTPLRAAALRAAGAWKLENLRLPVEIMATGEQTPAAVRAAAVDALVLYGGADGRNALETIAASQGPLPLRARAVVGLTAFDVQAAAPLAVRLLKDLPAESDPQPIVEAFLSRRGGSAALARAVSGAKLARDTARLALRVVRSSGSEHPELSAALRAAGDVQEGPRKLAPAELETLLALVSQADPARGEAVFRRKELGCLKCHAIGGAGGTVGPDLVSIGASAQRDYLIESLLDPAAKVKENYHTTIVLTDEGRVLGGIKVRTSDTQLILRDAEDRELHVPLASIDEQKDGGSLMPPGLVDALTGQELAELVRFLSELGKVGPFAVSPRPVVRRWETVANTPENRATIAGLGLAAAAAHSGLVWEPVYSRVSGALPLAQLPRWSTNSEHANAGAALLRFQIQVTTAGPVQLAFDPPEGVQLMNSGGKLSPVAGRQVFELAAGLNTLTLAIGPDHQDAKELRVELESVPGSPARAQLVGGK